MRIATWNVNGVVARLDFILHWLEARQPDLVGLQETKRADEEFPHERLREAGYFAATHGQRGWNGVAVLSRKPIEPRQQVQTGLPGQEDFGARLLGVEAEGLLFHSLYVPNGKHLGHEDFPRKLGWLDALCDHFERSHDPAQPLVLGGDFNLCPAPIDSWNEQALHGKIFHTDEERARWRRLLGWGFQDLFREQHPETQAFSWWDYRGGAFHRKQGLRIDFLLATPSVLSRVRSVTIDRDYRKKQDGLTASDHAPVIADLD